MAEELPEVVDGAHSYRGWTLLLSMVGKKGYLLFHLLALQLHHIQSTHQLTID